MIKKKTLRPPPKDLFAKVRTWPYFHDLLSCGLETIGFVVLFQVRTEIDVNPEISGTIAGIANRFGFKSPEAALETLKNLAALGDAGIIIEGLVPEMSPQCPDNVYLINPRLRSELNQRESSAYKKKQQREKKCPPDVPPMSPRCPDTREVRSKMLDVRSKPKATPLSESKSDSNDSPKEEKGLVYFTKKGRQLKGQALADFERFMDVFCYNRGKADGADAWLDIQGGYRHVFAAILHGAACEAKWRQGRTRSDPRPKMAQGWLSSRRWEDYEGDAATGSTNLTKEHTMAPEEQAAFKKLEEAKDKHARD